MQLCVTVRKRLTITDYHCHVHVIWIEPNNFIKYVVERQLCHVCEYFHGENTVAVVYSTHILLHCTGDWSRCLLLQSSSTE